VFITDNWLFQDFTFVPEEPNADFLLVEYLFASDSTDSSGNGIDGIDTNSPVYAGGEVELDGTNWIEVGFAAADVNNPFGGCESYTVAIDVNSDTGIGLIFSSARAAPNGFGGGEEQPYNPDDPCDDRIYSDTHSLAISMNGEEGESFEEIVVDRWWIGASGVGTDTVGVPHRVVATYDAEEALHVIYVDGESGEAFSSEDWYGCDLVPDPNDDTVLIGNTLNSFFPIGEGISTTFDGKLDNMQIYTYTWSEENVVYDSGTTDPFPVPVDELANMNVDGAFPANIIDFLDQAVFAPQWYQEKIFE
jgi:hypothetical protein